MAMKVDEVRVGFGAEVERAKATADEHFDHVGKKVGEAKRRCDKVALVVEVFQLAMIILLVILGWVCCFTIIDAASNADATVDYSQYAADFTDRANQCRENDEVCKEQVTAKCRQHVENVNNEQSCNNRLNDPDFRPYDYKPHAGSIIARNGGGCQAHYLLGTALGWAKGAEATLTNMTINTGVKSKKDLGSVSFGGLRAVFLSSVGTNDPVTIKCPIDAGDQADCSLLHADWETAKRPWTDDYGELGARHEDTSDIYKTMAAFMPIWLLLKLVSLNADYVDALMRKITCGMIGDNTGLLDDLMLDFDIFKRCPILQFICKTIVKYFRFKLVSNIILWPLTTLGVNSKCSDHAYTKMPHHKIWWIMLAVVTFDGLYLLAYYFATCCCKTVKTWRILYLPFVGITVFNIFALFSCTMFTNSLTFAFGWNFSLVFSFKMSLTFSMFQMFFCVLSIIEQVSLIGTIFRKIRKQDPEAKVDQMKAKVDEGMDNMKAKVDKALDNVKNVVEEP